MESCRPKKLTIQRPRPATVPRNLYIYACVCDEGFRNSHCRLFWAGSRVEVASTILKRVRNYLEHPDENAGRDSHWYHELTMMGMFDKLRKGSDTCPKLLDTLQWFVRTPEEVKAQTEQLMARGEWHGNLPLEDDMVLKLLTNITPEDLLLLIDESVVDGDSSFEVSITEIKMEDIIDTAGSL
jgi:hypothetical protein